MSDTLISFLIIVVLVVVAMPFVGILAVTLVGMHDDEKRKRQAQLDPTEVALDHLKTQYVEDQLQLEAFEIAVADILSNPQGGGHGTSLSSTYQAALHRRAVWQAQHTSSEAQLIRRPDGTYDIIEPGEEFEM